MDQLGSLTVTFEVPASQAQAAITALRAEGLRQVRVEDWTGTPGGKVMIGAIATLRTDGNGRVDQSLDAQRLRIQSIEDALRVAGVEPHLAAHGVMRPTV